ncbi:MAG: hypothetical protein IH963_05035 [Chloroflexi bacterium]|nr:hypothetical protein [Chloroflexota bacterium]
MYKLKFISTEAIPGALDKAERYRLLNEPREAESICRDILQADPDNQQGLVLLLLSLTDQFGRGCDVPLQSVQDILTQLHSEYERAYYAGVILERWGKAQLQSGIPSHTAYDWLREAMVCYEKAEAIQPPGNAEAIFRWNTCARIINQATGQGMTTAGRSTAVDPDGDDEVPMI